MLSIAYSQFENSLSDEMCHHLMNKRIPQFWKTWNANFKKNVSKKININGHINDVDIANEFAAHFKRVFTSCGDDEVYGDFVRKRADYISDDVQSSFECIDKVTVELIDKCVKDLKIGKACGPDDLGAEHLLCAHPALIMHLQNLFKLILCHSIVPNSFGVGITIPLVKDKTGNINDVYNYRGITLSPIISKLFEVVLLSMCNAVLKTDSLQFGFKEKVGTVDALFTLTSTIKHFTDRCSAVYLSSLDICKAFDRVNHYKMYMSLLEVGFPVIIVDVLCNWYGKLYYAVRWNSQISEYFAVNSGVRQGSCLSPALFNVFMNVFITSLNL